VTAQSNQWDNLVEGSRVIRQLADSLRRMKSLEDCPEDMKLAYLAYIQALDEFSKVSKDRLATIRGYLVAKVTIQLMLRETDDEGYKDIRDAEKGVDAAWRKIEELAVKKYKMHIPPNLSR
jgi:hypothetical protein